MSDSVCLEPGDDDSDPEAIRRRYADPEAEHLHRERPGGRLLWLGESGHSGQPIMLTEFGGIAISSDPETWGYSRCRNVEEFARRTRRCSKP